MFILAGPSPEVGATLLLRYELCDPEGLRLPADLDLLFLLFSNVEACNWRLGLWEVVWVKAGRSIIFIIL